MNELMKPVIVLTAICVVAAALLGFTYNITAPLIAQAEEDATNAAMAEVVPGATSFTPCELSTPIEGVLAVSQADGGLGYAIQVQDQGYGGAYVVMVGIGPDGKITIDGSACNHCGRCVGACPFGAVTEGLAGYKGYIGGRWGKKVAHGQALDKIFTSEDEVMDLVERAILFFRDEGESGERFADTVARLGFDYVQEKLLTAPIDKEAILGKTVIGGATC